MAQPSAYNLSYSFVDFQTSNPSTPLPADKLEVEFGNVATSINQLRTNIAQLQADDGSLHVGIVTPQTLSTSTLALLSATTGTVRGQWLTATAYVAKDVVYQAGGTYICNTPHTSGTFATDLAALKWVLIAGSAGSVALDDLTDVIITTPVSGNILRYNGTNWINGLLVDANITAGTISFASLASTVANTSVTLAGAADTNFPTSTAIKTYVDTQISRGTGTPVASATTTSLTGTYDYVHVTGTNTITGITLATDEEVWVVFDGACTLTHNATSLILPGGANITTAANDRAKFRGINGTNVICLAYQKADGTAIVVTAPATSVKTVKSQVFTGNATYTPSTGMLYCKVRAWGGGGAGGGAAAAAGAVGGGGGAGAYSERTLTAAQIGASKAVVIGAAGTGGASTGGTGGDTTMTTLVVAKGGLGGVVGAGSTNVLGGAGGAKASGTGDTVSTGACGGFAAGNLSGAEFSGAGGATALGGNGNGQFYTAEAAGVAAVANSGSGGGGAASNGSAHNGGAGGTGYMIIDEWCSQ